MKSCGKVKHRTREAAMTVQRKTGKSASLIAYKCPECHAWHLGNNRDLAGARIDQLLARYIRVPRPEAETFHRVRGKRACRVDRRLCAEDHVPRGCLLWRLRDHVGWWRRDDHQLAPRSFALGLTPRQRSAGISCLSDFSFYICTMRSSCGAGARASCSCSPMARPSGSDRRANHPASPSLPQDPSPAILRPGNGGQTCCTGYGW